MEMRKKIASTIAASVLAAASFTATFAAIPNTSPNPKTFLGPTAHIGIVKGITDESAFALAGEAGPKNLRASGTVGWEFDYHQRMKATAEYLRQQLTYSFYDGTQDVWMGQGAVGLNYQYDFRQIDPVNTLLDMTAYYAHSPSKGLGIDHVMTTTTPSLPATVKKRVAGADAFGFGPGISIVTLAGTTANLELNYDNVQYDTKYMPGKTTKGLGGTMRLSQAITDDVSIGGSAAVRRPFNNYQANITIANLDYYGMWSVSGFGEYTIGKNAQPSSYNVGLGADYFFDAEENVTMPQPQGPKPAHYKDYKDYKDLPPLVWQDPNIVDKELLTWVSIPAVRVPNVYTVVDECLAPSFSGTIGPVLTGVPQSVVDLSEYFNPGALIFGITQNGLPLDPSGYTLVGNILTFNNTENYTNVVVTASNGCGVATSNTFRFVVD